MSAAAAGGLSRSSGATAGALVKIGSSGTPNLSGGHSGETIGLFNHKGGVGKSTTTAALGWKLAQDGSKVLLVDADSQC